MCQLRKVSTWIAFTPLEVQEQTCQCHRKMTELLLLLGRAEVCLLQKHHSWTSSFDSAVQCSLSASPLGFVLVACLCQIQSRPGSQLYVEQDTQYVGLGFSDHHTDCPWVRPTTHTVTPSVTFIEEERVKEERCEACCVRAAALRSVLADNLRVCECVVGGAEARVVRVRITTWGGYLRYKA